MAMLAPSQILDSNLMIDIETTSADIDSNVCPGILSIAAQTFSRNGTSDSPYTFYRESSLQAIKAAGLHISESTMDWWKKRSIEMPSGDLSQNDLITEFLAYTTRIRSHIRFVWANGPQFDIAILRRHFKRMEYRWPFEYYEERDVRTVVSEFMLKTGKRLPASPDKHNALADVIHQIKAVVVSIQ